MIEVIKFEKRGKDWTKKVNYRFDTLIDMKNWKKAVEVMTKKKIYLTFQEI